MKNIRTYIILALILAAFLAGQFSGNSGKDAEKELKERYEAERKFILDQLQKKQVEIWHLTEGIKAERNKRNADSLRAWSEVAKRDHIISQMKTRNENRSFRTYSDHQLDSLRARYY